MKLCLTTNKTDLALEAEQAGIERVMIDLETIGKQARQAGHNTFISDHQMTDISILKSILKNSALVVRINPLHQGSNTEIDEAIERGADLLMLPFFHSPAEVSRFLELVGGRAKTSLLLETKAAAEHLAEIVNLPGIDEIHIGLNDLAISAGYTVIFEPFCNGEIERLVAIAKSKSIPVGIGGVTGLYLPGLPVAPEIILAEQIRLGAEIAWLSRSFSRELEKRRAPGELAEEVSRLRRALAHWRKASEAEFKQNRAALRHAVEDWKAAVVADSRLPR
jgi:hypothetical protein